MGSAVHPGQRALEWARSVLALRGVVFLDTETTGVREFDEVIEIAVLDASGRVLLQSLVQPTRPVDPAAVRVHGLTDAVLARAPSWPMVYRELCTVLCSVPLVITYNAEFDRRLIAQTCARHRLPPPQLDWHCAMRRFAEYAGPPPVDSWRRYHRLAEALERLGLSHSGSHRATADAEACRVLVHAMARGVPLRF
ncbi:MAG: exonuclease domain-containing protein [Thermomicrobium sp.]